MRENPPIEQEQEASWLEQIPQIEEKSPIEREQESIWLEQKLGNEGNSPNKAGVGNKSVGANSRNRVKIPN